MAWEEGGRDMAKRKSPGCPSSMPIPLLVPGRHPVPTLPLGMARAGLATPASEDGEVCAFSFTLLNLPIIVYQLAF